MSILTSVHLMICLSRCLYLFGLMMSILTFVHLSIQMSVYLFGLMMSILMSIQMSVSVWIDDVHLNVYPDVCICLD